MRIRYRPLGEDENEGDGRSEEMSDSLIELVRGLEQIKVELLRRDQRLDALEAAFRGIPGQVEECVDGRCDSIRQEMAQEVERGEQPHKTAAEYLECDRCGEAFRHEIVKTPAIMEELIQRLIREDPQAACRIFGRCGVSVDPDDIETGEEREYW